MINDVKKRKKRLVCLQIHNDYQIPGGETKTAKAIASLLEAHGVDVIRYYRSNNDLKTYGWIGTFKRGVASLYSIKTKREIERILNESQVDFALVHNTMPLISNSVYKVLIKKEIPIIKYLQNYNLICLNGGMDNAPKKCGLCQKHGLIGVVEGCYKQNRLYSLLKYIAKEDMRRNIIKHISAFMANSEFVMKKHKYLGIPKRNLFVMYNYIANTNVSHVRNKSILPENYNHQQYYLYFGRLSPEKGIRTVMEAFSSNTDLKLIILGSGILEGEIKKIIKERSLCNIVFLGSKQGEDLYCFVRDAKAVIVSSEWNEPLPRTILEAYNEGTPVIGTDRGGIPEMIRAGENGFIYKSGDVHELLSCISMIERMDAITYEKMRANAKATIARHYSVEKYFERFYSCLTETGIITN